MSLLWFVILIGVLITVHEAGHFFLARLFHVKVLRLSLGFGPRLASVRRGETEYTLSAIPLGGYVKLLGEDPSDTIDEDERERAFPYKPLWQRLLIVLAGPAANLIFPAAIHFHFYAAQETAASTVIGTVFEGHPADQVLKSGDRIIAVDDESVRYWDELDRIIARSPGRDLRVTVERPGEDKPLTRIITPRAHERRDALGAISWVGKIGIVAPRHLAQIGVSDFDAANPAEPSPAARAGLRTFDVVVAVQGRPVETWSDLERVLAQNRGEPLPVTYLRRQGNPIGWASVARLEPGTAQVFPSRVVENGRARYDSGMRPGDMFLHTVEPGTPAAEAGLAPGDMLTSVDGTPIRHWELLNQMFEERRDRDFTLGWRTPRGEQRTRRIHLQPRTERDEYDTESTLFVFGAEPCKAVRAVPGIPIEGRLPWAIRRAAESTVEDSWTMLRIFAHLLVGRLPLSEVGGPILIYHLAGVAGARGQFLRMLAMVSLNLGLLNLLPVPLLDGGHLLFFGIEALRKRPLGRRTRERAAYVGMVILGALMLLALRNDILRAWF